MFSKVYKFTSNDLNMVIYKMLSYPINNIKYKITSDILQ
jgi:hypothetical protein